jgi:aspartyl-tRNA synthetase
MENIYRNRYCGEITKEDIGKEVKVAGWINSIRNLGSIVFMTLRDETGIVQIVSQNTELFNDLVKESTATVKGIVQKRNGEVNPKMKTGEIEIDLKSIEVLGKCEPILPFEVSRSRDASEETRLKYRYLDLRNPEVHENILFRSKVIDFIRQTMKGMDFTEIQTPIVTATSPEGARDFIIPSRKFKGKFYALPQAPQIFKQLLMVSGFNKYFQIAPCFRDEDPRSDRLYGEFYQLDFEMSFATDEDVYKVGEKVFYDIFSTFTDKEVSKPPFRRIPYRESMLKYGSDKPDLRNPLVIEDVTDILSKAEFDPFKNTTIRCIKVEKMDKANSWYKSMEEYVKSIGAVLGYIKYTEEGFKSSLDKFFNDEIREELKTKFNLSVGDSLFIIANNDHIEKKMGLLRTKLGEELELIDKNKYEFCIVNDFPFFEMDEENNSIAFSHNPFSMPQGGMDALMNKDPLDILAYQYDFVCNGIEMASGAVRNHDLNIMKKAFEVAGYDETEIEKRFKALYEAFKYGAPPHAGMALGIDRLLMLMLSTASIRDTVAFPLSASGADNLMQAPNEVSELQLREAHIKVRD